MAEIRINDKILTGAEIDREVQYHPARNAHEARQKAAVALSIRALLLDEAERLGITGDAGTTGETRDEARIRCLLERELQTPETDEAACRTFFQSNRERFRAPGRYQVSHILRPAPPHDAEARVAARNRCARLISVAQADRARFADLARRHSRCPSGADGGALGEIGPGATCPEFEKALDRLPIDSISKYPLETRYGFHVVWLHARDPGRLLTFAEAQPVIANYLRESVWRRALSQYVRILAAGATIEGVDLDAAATPLLQ